MSSYDHQFVSCEDDMPPKLGFFNGFCTVTSIVIMLVPVHFLQRATKIVLFDGRTDKIELLFMAISMTSLFFFNLFQHATGYIGPPCIDTFGCVNNLMLSTVLYKVWYNRFNMRSIIQKKRIPVPRHFTIVMISLSFTLLVVGFVKVKFEQIATKSIFGPIGAYVVLTMGKLSWNYSKKESEPGYWSPLNLWKSACIFAILVVIFVESERSLCHLGSEFSRLYHSIFLHIIIPIMFWCISECAFRLDESEEEVPKKDF